jgi:hypothetical protein
MGKHAECGPSSLPRIFRCPGSVNASRQVRKQKSSIWAERGTYKHTFVEPVFVNGPAYLDDVKDYDDPDKPMSQQDKEEILTCVDYAQMLLATCSDNSEVFFEKRITLEPWGLPEVWGTSDFGIIDYDSYIAHIVDWKFGSGVQVYVEKNEQLLAYGAGSIGHPTTIMDICLHVVQPPLQHFDKWWIKHSEMVDWVADELTPALEAAAMPDAPLIPGDKQCKFCNAKYDKDTGSVCPARHKKAQVAAAEVFSMAVQLDRTPIEEVAKMYREHMKYYANYIKDITKILHGHALAGGRVPTMKLVHGRGRRDWENEKAAAKWLMDNTNLEAEQIYPSKIVSPAAAEKLNRKLKKDENFQALYKTYKGSLQLVDATDPREEVKPATAEEAFKDVPTT